MILTTLSKNFLITLNTRMFLRLVEISTSPEVTEKLSEVNLATPIFDVLANSPAIVKVLPEAVVFIPSPAKNSKTPPNLTLPCVEDSSVK